MNYFKILIIIAFVSISCSEKTSKSLTLEQLNSNNNEVFLHSFIDHYMSIPQVNFPFNNDSVNQFINFNSSYDYDGNKKTTALFHNNLDNSNEFSSFVSKNEIFSYKPTSTSEYLKGKYFYPISRFKMDSTYLIIFLYQDFEDIVPAVKTQINSYNFKGEIIDTLLLDNRFSFELIYKNDFVLNTDYSINISEFIISYYDSLDNLIPSNSLPKVVVQDHFYRINANGMFNKEY